MVDKRKVVIVDIDGTVAHRVDRDWFEYDKALSDRADYAIVSLVASLWYDGYKVIFVSGREDSCEDVTREWLRLNCPPYTHLFMRKRGDFREDSVVKREIYETLIEPHYDVLCVFDDRNQVVDMWREIGLKCLQVQPGDF